MYNEIQTGHLHEFFKYNSGLFDNVLVYDDGSTDGSFEYCKKFTENIIRSSSNNYKGEMGHKKLLLESANELSPDYIVSLDADEILLLSRSELEEKCTQLNESGYDGIRVNFINLWRSFNYKRTDSLFNEYRPIKIWKHKKELDPYADVINELHQPLHPQYVTNILNDFSINILHTGFSSEERILRKFLIYKKHGQTGFDLMRLIDEKKLELEEVPAQLIPKGLYLLEEMPKAQSIKYYIENSIKLKNIVFKPKVSIICLIYKDIGWLEFVYQQVLKFTNLSENEFFFVANGATQEVKDYLYNNYIPHYIYDHTDEQKQEHYINNVYRAYNYGVEMAKGDFAALINSDMAFTDNWLENLLNKYNGNNCVASRLVECGKISTGKYGIEKNFGNDFNDYMEDDFCNYASELSENKLEDSGLYMPLLVNITHFNSVGGYPEGNVRIGSDLFNPEIALPDEKVISGDTVIMGKLLSNGIVHQTAFDSIAYHFQEGEKRSDPVNVQSNLQEYDIAICNDILTGTMGEKVLWDYLLTLPKTIGLSYERVEGKKSLTFQKYIEDNCNNVKIILQNATFIDTIHPELFTIVFLQDDLRRMNNPSLQQEQNLQNADICVTNSYYTASSYPEFDFEIIPVGVDAELFYPKQKVGLRTKWGLSIDKKIGIFVGALNDVKGWPQVLDVIENDESCYWIIVTKHNELFDHPRVTLFNRLNQQDLSELLSCSDFFILGSKVETQCLAAIEAVLCDIPVIMNKTGIFGDIDNKHLDSIGIFDQDFKTAVKKIGDRKFKPRETILHYPITIEQSVDLWRELLCKAKLNALDNKYRTPKNINTNKRSIISRAKFKLEFVYRKNILGAILGRDHFYSIAEISVYLKNHIPQPIFSILRSFWRVLRPIKK